MCVKAEIIIYGHGKTRTTKKKGPDQVEIFFLAIFILSIIWELEHLNTFLHSFQNITSYKQLNYLIFWLGLGILKMFLVHI